MAAMMQSRQAAAFVSGSRAVPARGVCVPRPAQPALPARTVAPSARQLAPCPSRQLGSGRSVACQGLFGLGLPEVALIAGIAALVFGPSKLPELGKGLGKTIKSFQGAAKEFENELKAATADEEAPKDGAAPKEVAAVAKPEEPKKP
jgi:sec-independent protein translocase protein TatA